MTNLLSLILNLHFVNEIFVGKEICSRTGWLLKRVFEVDYGPLPCEKMNPNRFPLVVFPKNVGAFVIRPKAAGKKDQMDAPEVILVGDIQCASQCD
jgi:hypothetical protein